MYYYTGFSFDVLLHSFRRRYACNDGYEILAQVVQFQEARTECVKPETYGRGTGTIQPSNRNYAKSKPENGEECAIRLVRLATIIKDLARVWLDFMYDPRRSYQNCSYGEELDINLGGLRHRKPTMVSALNTARTAYSLTPKLRRNGPTHQNLRRTISKGNQ